MKERRCIHPTQGTSSSQAVRIQNGQTVFSQGGSNPCSVSYQQRAVALYSRFLIAEASREAHLRSVLMP